MQIAVKHYRTVYTNGDFVIAIYLQLQEKGERFVTCKGYGLPQNQNCFYLFDGEEVEDPRTGKKVFKVSNYMMTEPKTGQSLNMFFSGDDFLGIGKDIIRRIVKEFGSDTFRTIEEDPERILSVSGMNAEKLRILVRGYQNASSFKKLTKFLSPMGISSRAIRLINDARYDETGIRDDPFSLLDIKGVGFKTCDTIARYLNTALDSPSRIKGSIIEAMQEFTLSGSTYVIDSELIERALFKLNDGLSQPAVSGSLVIDCIMQLINDEQIHVDEGHKMMLFSYYEAEEKTARQLCNLNKAPVDGKYDLLNAASRYHDRQLSDCQKKAVECSLSNKVSIITGGAGTGKTTIMNAIIAAYREVFPSREIVLLAPTGKAARRISEVTGIEASTIHSRLNLYEGSEAPGSYIPSGLIIVDEFSMVDMLLFEKLMEAVSFSCQTVFVGDINQLPSVGAGACLKDMIESGVIPVSHLTDVFRQESGGIIDNCRKIIAKNCDLHYDQTMMNVKVSNENTAIDEIRKIYSYYAENEGISNVALICPLRSTQEGRFKAVADGLNPIIQEQMSSSDAVSYQNGNTTFRVGDRVMMWKNTEFVSNGDVGTVVDIDLDSEEWGMEMKIVWENGITLVYHKPDLGSITLAYAMSVHKSQGSEYDTVIIPILKEQKCRLFRNEMLYTAISRAKKRCILVTDDESSIDFMINHSDAKETRKTLFKNRLIKNA